MRCIPRIRFNTLGSRLLVLPLLSLAGFALLGGITLFVLNQTLRHDKEAQLVAVVELGHALLASYEQQVKSGALSPEAAQQAAKLAVKNLRYAGTEYLWINDLGTPIPKMIMHPTVPALDGQVLDKPSFLRATGQYGRNGEQEKTYTGTNLFLAFSDVANSLGEGFVSYEWPKPQKAGGVSEALYPKLSFVKKFEPWGWVIGSGVYIDDLHTAFLQMAEAVLATVSLGILFTLLAAWHVRRWILNAVGGEVSHASEAAARIAAGDLATRIPYRPQAHASLLQALDDMRTQLEGLVRSMIVDANSLTGDMRVLTADATNMGIRLSLQKGSSDEVLAAVEAMREQIKLIASLAAETEQHAQIINRHSEDGERVMHDAADSMGRIAQTIRDSTQDVQEMVVRAESIGTIVATIKEIAEQTNLLALNAAIEAARAGEQGRGFAVVADEVRKLAVRTAGATAEITEVITQVRSSVGQVVRAMEAAGPLVEQGERGVGHTTALFAEFRIAAGNATTKMEALAQVVGEQVANATNVAAIVGQSITITEQAVLMVDTTSAVAARAEKSSIDLAQIAKHFTVHQNENESAADAGAVRLEWSNRLAIGFASIDTQHQKLIEIFNNLQAAMLAKNDRAGISSALSALMDYTQYHFKHEAELMHKAQYPDRTAHLKQHDDLIAKAVSYVRRFESGDSIDTEVLSFFRDWLINHILKTDQSLANFLNGKKTPVARAAASVVHSDYDLWS